MSSSKLKLLTFLRQFAEVYGLDPDEFILGVLEYCRHSPLSLEQVADEVTSTIVLLDLQGVW